MELKKAMEDRYSVRSFKKDKVADSEITAILEAGRVAPTACNYQPQRIVVIKSEEGLNKLKNCTRCHFDAPLAMLVCYDESACWHRPYDGVTSGYVDGSIVTTHMMLAAWEKGIGSCWVMHFKPEAMREEFGLKETEVPVALLVMGYPSDEAKPINLHFENKPMDELVRYE